MSLEQIALASLLLQLLFVPGAVWFGSFLWRLERRIYRAELELGIEHTQEA